MLQVCTPLRLDAVKPITLAHSPKTIKLTLCFVILLVIRLGRFIIGSDVEMVRCFQYI